MDIYYMVRRKELGCRNYKESRKQYEIFISKRETHKNKKWKSEGRERYEEHRGMKERKEEIEHEHITANENDS